MFDKEEKSNRTGIYIAIKANSRGKGKIKEREWKKYEKLLSGKQRKYLGKEKKGYWGNEKIMNRVLVFGMSI